MYVNLRFLTNRDTRPEMEHRTCKYDLVLRLIVLVAPNNHAHNFKKISNILRVVH